MTLLETRTSPLLAKLAKFQKAFLLRKLDLEILSAAQAVWGECRNLKLETPLPAEAV